MPNKKRIFTILMLIILAGTLLRFYKLGEVSLVADEFLDMNASYGYFKTGDWHAWDFNFSQPAERINAPSDERAWIYRWQAAQLFRILPPTESAARAVSAVWGVISLAVIYFVAASLTKKKEIGLLSAALFAVSISGIIMDRHVRMYAMFFPVFLLFSWSVFKFLESEYYGKSELVKKINKRLGLNVTYLLPALALGLLSFHLHQLTGNVAVILLTYIIILAVIKFRSNHLVQNKYSIFLAIIIISFVLVSIFASSLVNYFLGTLTFFTNHPSYTSIVFRDYSNAIIALLFIATGIIYLIKTRLLAKEAIWLSASFFVPLLMAIFLWKRNVGEQYIFFIQSFEIILIATGIYAAAVFFEDNLKKYGKKPFYAVIVISLLVLPNYAYFFADNNTYAQTSKSENPNYRSVFSYFKKNKKPGDVLITRDFRNYYWSGEEIKTYDFGGELSKEKFRLADLQKIMSENQTGWFIYSDNDEDYIANETQNYVEKNLEKINAIAVRGSIKVYRWGN